jgi:hypothetical protein
MRVRPSAAAIVIAVAFAYCAWLGAHWLRFSYSSGELPIYASRVWDLERELARSHRTPWWTKTFHDGSSEAFVYATGAWIAPWTLLARGLGLVAAGKVLTLLAIGAAGVSMFFCAKRFLRSDSAAALAALAYLFHPQLLARAGGVEHLYVVMFVPLVPLAWLTLARALDRARFADAFACAVSLDAMLWMQTKQTLVQLVFLTAFAAWSIARDRERRPSMVKALATIAALALPMAAFFVTPLITELRALKLFEGDPLEAWQRMYSLADVGALVDRRADQFDYAGVVTLTLAALAILYGHARRARALFHLVVACEAAAIALGHGPSSVASSAFRDLATQKPHLPMVLFALGFAVVVAEVSRRKLKTIRARLIAIVACAAFLFVPWFRLVALVPFYGDVRAPVVFYEVPGMFFGALLAGFFVTDVVESGRFALRAPLVVGAIAVLILADASPFEHWMTTCDVPARTIDNARAMYGALGAEAAQATPERGTENGKVYVVGGRFFHVMGPSWGGPPLVTEAGISYMAPRGTGMLAAVAGESLATQRAYLDLVGVKWLVFDKSDPQSHTPALDAQLAAYRKIYPLDREDDDFAVFRVPHARAFVSGYAHAAIVHGEARRTPQLAIAIAHEGYALVHADGEGFAVPGEMTATTVAIDPDPALSPLPPKLPREDALADLSITRDTDDRIDARFTASTACIAVIDESAYPFWHATLDGHATPILRVAYGLMGIAVSAGAHDVVLTYEPPGAYGWCAVLSASAFVIFAIAAFVTSRRARVTSRA